MKLTKDNYKSVLPINIALFSFAEDGAMGMPGEVNILDWNNRLYTFNYVFEEWCNQLDVDLIPIREVMQSSRIDEFDQTEDAKWVCYRLGYGNHLFVTTKFWDNQFGREAVRFTEPGELYNRWLGMARQLLTSLYGKNPIIDPEDEE